VTKDATVLVANRGEIALRIFRTARRLGMRTVAVYSQADAGAPHVRAADVAVEIGPAPASESYLRRDVIVQAALETGAGLVHPGYGFLAEDDRFAQACEDAGLRFVGPPSAVLRVVGDKASSRALANDAGVPVFPGYGGDDQRTPTLIAEAERIGFPLIVKPAGGGGGKGMSVVRSPADLPDALEGARRVAKAAFDDDRLILERYIEGPRHVEVQVFADTHGTVIHLGERDCSLQRRHQKVLEEAPAPHLDDRVRTTLHDAAVAFARRAGYVGAGTCEFLVAADGTAGFIEMNARLQVEHPVTEMVTGLDLVEMQLRTALGEPLAVSQDTVTLSGHAFEVRVYAEDPRNGFVPQAGRVSHVRWPELARVDTWIEEGTEVSTFYDPLLAKIVVHADDRAKALDALDDALRGTEILGPRTNLPFLAAVIADPVVREGRVTTDWLSEQDLARLLPSDSVSEAAWLIAAAAEADGLAASASSDPFVTLGAWRAAAPNATTVVLRAGDEERVVNADVDHRGPAVRVGETWLVWADGDQHEIAVGAAPRLLAAGPARLDSPLPGRVVDVRVVAGASVSSGDELVVVEAMKMEHAIRAPSDGVVRAVLCSVGDQVTRGQALVDIEPG
jgi:acetyl/propionyl-CoA carboxylase alpha subunit